MMLFVAWIPFLEPMHALHSAWLVLSIPLVIGISMVHKALQTPEHKSWAGPVAIMSMQVMLGLIALAVVFDVFVQWVIPVL